jgi:hypothetical protein
MEKSAIIIIGAMAVGYALASINKANEIRKSECDSLKKEYEGQSNISMGLLALGGLIIVFAGIIGGME